jgi:tetratricopeptide (TPR) repeat protein
MRWLSPSYWEVEEQLTVIQNFQKRNTLPWALDMLEFKKWRTSPAGSRENLLWIRGPPLVGKSTAAAMFIDGLRQSYPNCLVTYFMCRRSKSMLRNTSNVICTLAFQAASSDDNIRLALQEVKDKGLSITHESECSVLNSKLLREPLSQSSKEIFIVLDGLDEIENRLEWEGLLNVLANLSSSRRTSQSAIRLLVLTRPHDIQPLIQDFVHARMYYHDNERDIETYVNEVILSSERLRLLFLKVDVDPFQYFREKANGTFIWAVNAINELSNVKSVEEFRTTLHALSEGSGSTEALYLEILSGFSAVNRRRIDIILQWVLVAKRPLTINELRTAVEWSLQDEFMDFQQFVDIHCCGSLLKCSQPSTTVTTVELMNQKLREVLLRPSRAEQWPNYVDEQTAHSHASLLCLSRLQSHRMESALKDFEDYSDEFWTYHLSRSKTSGVQLLSIVYRFFTSEHLTVWMTTYLTKRRSFSLTSRFEFDEPDWSAVLAWLRQVDKEVDLVKWKEINPEDNECQVLLDWREKVLNDDSFDDYLGKAAVRAWLSNDVEDFVDVAAAFHLAYKYYRSRGSADDPDDLFGDLILNDFIPIIDWAGMESHNQRNVGTAFASLHRYRDAIRCYLESTSRSGNPVAWEYLGHMYHAIGDHNAAINAYENAFQRDPTRARPLAYLTYVNRDIIPSIDISGNRKVSQLVLHVNVRI